MDWKKRIIRYSKRVLYPIVSGCITFFLVKGINFILNNLDPGWLVIFLMPIAQVVLPLCAAFFSFYRRMCKEADEDGELEKILKPTTASNITVQHQEEQGPDRIITTQNDLDNFMQQYTVIDELRTKVVGVTFRNDDGSNRQSVLALCHTGADILLRYYEYQGAPAYEVQTEYGPIGNLPKELAWELGQYGDDIYVAGKILAVTGGDKGKYFGCNIILTIYGPK